MEQQPVVSKLIASYSYDSASQNLSVTFVTDTDTTHVYSGVSSQIVSQVFDGPGSLGSKFIKLIKNGNFKHSVAND